MRGSLISLTTVTTAGNGASSVSTMSSMLRSARTAGPGDLDLPRVADLRQAQQLGHARPHLAAVVVRRPLAEEQQVGAADLLDGLGDGGGHGGLVGGGQGRIGDDDGLVGADRQRLLHRLPDLAVGLGDGERHDGDVGAALPDLDGGLEGVLLEVADLVRDGLQHRLAVLDAHHLEVHVRLHADDDLHAHHPSSKAARKQASAPPVSSCGTARRTRRAGSATSAPVRRSR